jgi:uncharacterized protein
MDTIQPFEPKQMAFAKGVSSTQIEPGQLLIKASVSADFKYQSING